MLGAMTSKHTALMVLGLVVVVGCGKSGDKGTNKAANKARTVEALKFVKKIYDGARAYYMDSHASPRSMAPVPRQFPGPSVGPTPPLGACCKQPKHKCAPQQQLWTNPVWVALQFSVDDPHYYSYSYIVKGNQFTARANGDLDCDGEYSTFEMHGMIDPQHAEGPTGSGAVTRIKALE